MHLYLLCFATVVVPAAAIAQSVSPAPAQGAARAAAEGVLPAAVGQAPAQSPAPAQAAPGPDLDTRSLFEPRLDQLQFSGRASSIDGDPARFQRYQDIRNGVLFTDARYARDDPGGGWLFRAGADNVGWRDQRYAAEYQRTGKFVVSGLWDQIPQFYSVDTRTPFSPAPSPLNLDDATQLRIQNGQANLNAWVPLATQFDLIERRDIGHVNFVATPKPTVDLTAAFTTQRHRGELPWGASFGFGNDVEVALPYDSRTNDFNLGAEWTNRRQMLRVSYAGSWFDNLDDTLIWDSPLRLTDLTNAPGRGRTALWPSNSAQTVSAAGYAKFEHRTQLTGFVSFGNWSNDEPLQPFTINATLPQLTLPRSNADATAHVFSTNLNLVSRPLDEWRFSARVRRYDYNNEMAPTPIPQFINYDASVTTSSTGGPELYAHNRTTFDADATWTGFQPVAMTVGYTRNNSGHDFRIFESTGEDVLRLTADAVGTQWVTFRADYELSSRNGSGLDESLLVQIGEQPALRHYDVADRTRNRFNGQVDIVPNDLWTFSVSGGVGKDDYDDSYFGLQESTFRVFSVGADLRRPDGWGAGASYNYERYSGFQQSRNASPGQTPPQETDPLRNWTVDSRERVNYFSIYATPPRFRRNTEARFSYDYSYAEGTYFYAIPPGSPLTPPNQLPNVYNKLQQLHLDVRHRLTNQWAATFSYLYEPFRVYDFAFDQTVVDSIVQPSSLVLGYVYRPYTAHSFVFGARYFW
jgi:MtrB/PioB family decaheme-associated outer membrane protein